MSGQKAINFSSEETVAGSLDPGPALQHQRIAYSSTTRPSAVVHRRVFRHQLARAFRSARIEPRFLEAAPGFWFPDTRGQWRLEPQLRLIHAGQPRR